MPTTRSATILTDSTRRAYDVFNGDADGICALHQLRMADPREAVLVSGVKRDIALLERVPLGQADEITICDISLDANGSALRRLLDDGCRVLYFDHHAAHQSFVHPALQLHWDESTDVCSSVLVDKHLHGRFRPWAVVAAFGDNLEHVADSMVSGLGMQEQARDALKLLGTVLNYNAYGESVADLHFAPDALFRAVHRFSDPLEFVADSDEYAVLLEGYQSDAARMENLRPAWSQACGAIYLLPNACWARRISGVLANRLASGDSEQAWAVLTEGSNGCFSASVRSGLPMTLPANQFCELFETGGGRKIAAGINRIPANDIENFAVRFFAYFGAGCQS